MNRIYLNLRLCLLIVLLTACKSIPTHSAEVVNIYSKDGRLMHSITNANAINSIKQAIGTRQETTVKILPLYKGSIEISINNKKQYWLISSTGYIKRQGNYNNRLYKIDKPEILFRFFG